MAYGASISGGSGGAAEGYSPLALPVPARALGPFTASGKVFSGAGRLIGWTLRATTATVVTVTLHDGTDANGQMLADMDASQGFAVSSGPGEPGIRFTGGLYFNVVAGAPSLVLWYVPDYGPDV